MKKQESSKKRKMIIINEINQLTSLANIEILAVLQSKLQIIQVNETVERYLLLRFQLENDSQLFSVLKPYLLIITRGEEKIDFITEDVFFSFNGKSSC